MVAERGSARPVTVTVNPPVVAGDTIHFTWQQDGPNPFQRSNAFSFRYEHLDLAQYNNAVFDEIFLASQLRVWRQHDGSVIVRFPYPVAASTAAFWTAFNKSDNVTVEPLHAAAAIDARRAGVVQSPTTVDAAVFLGGGKDSLTAASILGEQFGHGRVLLINMVAPLHPGPARARRLEERQATLIVTPARECLGFRTPRIWTSFLSNLEPDWQKQLLPHYQQFTAGGLPAMIASGATLSTISMAWPPFYTLVSPTGQRSASSIRSRPEMLAALSRHYQLTLGIDLTVTNLNLLMNEPTAFRILAERYPAAYLQLVSCPRSLPPSRFCHLCDKCVRFAFTSLAIGQPAPDFDYNFAILEGRWFQDIVNLAESRVPWTENSNAPWLPGCFGAPYFNLKCRQFWLLNPAIALPGLNRASRNVLHIARALYGNLPHHETDVMPVSVFPHLPSGAGPFAASIVGKYTRPGEPPAIDHPDGSGSQFIYDFRTVPPHPLFTGRGEES